VVVGAGGVEVLEAALDLIWYVGAVLSLTALCLVVVHAVDRLWGIKL